MGEAENARKALVRFLGSGGQEFGRELGQTCGGGKVGVDENVTGFGGSMLDQRSLAHAPAAIDQKPAAALTEQRGKRGQQLFAVRERPSAAGRFEEERVCKRGHGNRVKGTAGGGNKNTLLSVTLKSVTPGAALRGRRYPALRGI